MKNDKIYDNIANTATIHLSKPIFISMEGALFQNNSALNDISGIYIEESVINFTCYKCVFRENKAKSGGILTILKAENFALMYSEIDSNTAQIGHMVDIRETINCTISSALFRNNLCESEPCHLSITGSMWSVIKDSTFIHDANNSTIITDESNAVYIETQNLLMQNINDRMGAGGYALQVLNNEGSYFQNITSICPFHHTSLTSNSNMSYFENDSFDANNSFQFEYNSLFSASILNKFYFTKEAFKLKCIPCERNEYRMGLSEYSLQGYRKPNLADNTDICYKCPPGGHCKDHNVVAEPNYWGFIHNSRMYFVMCPEGYCCQSSPCESYDACGQGRTGHLCSSCQDGYRLSMLSEECLLIGQCEVAWVSFAIISSGCVYIAFLLVKVEIANVLFLIKQTVGRHFKKKGEASEKYQLKTIDFPTNIETGITKSPNNFMQPDPCNRNTNWHETMSGPVISNMNQGAPEYSASDFTSSDFTIPFDYEEVFHIIVYHFQDTGLFMLSLPGMPQSPFSFEKYQERLTALARLDSGSFSSQITCLEKDTSEVRKLFIKTSIIPFMIVMYVIFNLVMKLVKPRPQLKKRMFASADTVFLMIIMFSFQQLSSSALSLVKCTWLGSGHYLRIDGNVKCYQPWQWATFAFIIICILPFWCSLFLGPGMLRHELITRNTFLMSLILPGPFLILSIIMLRKKTDIKVTCPDIGNAGILKEVWYSHRPFFSYNYLCWGGLVMLRRLGLVICATLIATPIARIASMLIILVIALYVHVRYKAYRDTTANAFCNISLFAMLLVGICNYGWATLLYTGSNFEYGDALKIGQGVVVAESFLIQGIPVGMVLFCIVKFIAANLKK